MRNVQWHRLISELRVHSLRSLQALTRIHRSRLASQRTMHPVEYRSHRSRLCSLRRNRPAPSMPISPLLQHYPRF